MVSHITIKTEIKHSVFVQIESAQKDEQTTRRESDNKTGKFKDGIENYERINGPSLY